MYALLSLLLATGFAHDWTDYGGADPFWMLSFLNVSIGIAAARYPTTRQLCVVLVFVDLYLGTLACTFEAIAEFHQVKRALVGWAALVIAAWLPSARRDLPFLPARGIWARKLVAASVLLFAQASSASGGAVLAVAGIPERIFYLEPVAVSRSQFACCLTLAFYLAPAWKYLSALRVAVTASRKQFTESHDSYRANSA